MTPARLVAVFCAAALCAPATALGQAGVSYQIPPDNPFVGRPGAAPEVYAYGFRNPFRFSFDRATGNLLIGDVGSGPPSGAEEINVTTLQGARGANFGWPCREGFGAGPKGCAAPGSTDPVFVYPTSGSAVIGGYVVRDPGLTGLIGRYLFADYYVGDVLSIPLGVTSPTDQPTGATIGSGLSSFGEDTVGHLYVADQGADLVHRLVPGGSPGSLATQTINGSYLDPSYIAAAPGDASRLFVVEQGGRIQLVVNGSKASAPFLDIASLVLAGGERGLLSMAFSPDYATSGRFYVYYTAANGNVQIDEFRRSTDPNRADLSTRRSVLTIAHPRGNHNGGQLQFGPDGYLYLATGDGGGQGDPDNNAQNLATLLGKLLRINPQAPPTVPGPTAVPAPAPDTLAPRLRTRIKRRQRVLPHRGVVAYARCSEACTVATGGTLRIRSRRFRMLRTSRAARVTRRSRLKVRLTRRGTRALRRALRRNRRASVRIGLRATDRAGNRSRLVRATVRVTRRR